MFSLALCYMDLWIYVNSNHGLIQTQNFHTAGELLNK